MGWSGIELYYTPGIYNTYIRVATKLFKDFDAFLTVLPLKERFFLLKPNVLCISMLKSITDQLADR